MPRLVLALMTLSLLVAAPADAAFWGSNGKVAWIATGGGLMVDDPHDDEPAKLLAQTSKGFPDEPTAPRSAPSWSPDGTKIAFTRAVPDTDPYEDHSAVFVMNADGTEPRQVSFPYPGVVPCDTCNDGEVTWDLSPVFKDDDTVAFIRWVAADDEAVHVAEAGTSVWTVSLSGGGGGLYKHVHKDTGLYQSIIWPNTWSEPLAVYLAKGQGFSLRKVTSGATFATEIGFNDVDAAPDGRHITYGAQTMSGPQHVVMTEDGEQVERFQNGVFPTAMARFTPDDNGLLMEGCAKDRDEADHCGFVTHRIPDPDADVRPDDPVNLPYVDMDLGSLATVDQPGHRQLFDIQSQDLPVIYAPGFLGSQILCEGESVWMPAAPPLTMSPMSLTADGKGNAACASAAPSGEVVDKFLGSDVYGHANDWLESMNPEGGWATYGWDWRKAPQESLEDLDTMIDQMLEKELLVAQGTKRVTLIGHSYGGLLIRAYIDEEARARKVGRVLTVGSPYHGAAKPIFGTAFGVELPSFGALDLMIDNADMKSFMTNLSGAYHLFPSDNYGPWLTVDQTLLGQDGVANFVHQIGGNKSLLSGAFQTHRDMIDGFYDRKGRIDYRAVVGVGLMTVGRVNLLTDPMDEEKWIAGVHYEDGDGTVPGRSGTQGPIGTDDPLGDDVHIQDRCGIAHMDQTKDKVVQGAYAQFLLYGRLPRRLPAADCPPEGREIVVYRGLEIPAPAGSGRAAGDEPTLGDLEFAGLIDVMELPGGTLIVTDEARPAPVRFTGAGTEFAVTELEGEQRGERVEYGPLTGEVAIDGSTVKLDGRVVEGEVVDDADPEPEPDEPKPDEPRPEVTPAPAATPAPIAAPAPAVKVTLAGGKLRARKGVVAIRVTSNGPFTGTLVLKAKKLGKIGGARVSLAKAGTVTVTVKLSRKARRARKLAATATLGAAAAKLALVR